MASLLLPLHQPKSYTTLVDPNHTLRKSFSPTSIRCRASSSSVPSSSSEVASSVIQPAHVNLFQEDRTHHHEAPRTGHDGGDDDDVEYRNLEDGHDVEDPRALREIWREIQGSQDWEGLLDPMNSHLRREIIRYGEFAQACYDSFDFDPHSKYCGSCKYLANDFFDKMHMSHYGYTMCRPRNIIVPRTTASSHKEHMEPPRQLDGLRGSGHRRGGDKAAGAAGHSDRLAGHGDVPRVDPRPQEHPPAGPLPGQPPRPDRVRLLRPLHHQGGPMPVLLLLRPPAGARRGQVPPQSLQGRAPVHHSHRPQPRRRARPPYRI